MMSNYSITGLEETQWVDEIDRVFKSAYTIEAELLGVKSFPPLARDKSEILSCGNSFFGAISEVGLCGVMELETDTPAGAETIIASLAIKPSHFRQGIGTALVRKAIEKRSGRVQVTTAKMNHPAIHLYTTQGFEIVRKFSTSDGFEMVELTLNLG